MSKLYIAAAGAGKTTFLVDSAFHQSSSIDNKRVCQEFCVNRFNKQHRIAA